MPLVEEVIKVEYHLRLTRNCIVININTSCHGCRINILGEYLLQIVVNAFLLSLNFQVGLLLSESLLLLGYFALFHPGNQAVLRWGHSPTILHKVSECSRKFFLNL